MSVVKTYGGMMSSPRECCTLGTCNYQWEHSSGVVLKSHLRRITITSQLMYTFHYISLHFNFIRWKVKFPDKCLGFIVVTVGG